MYPTYLTYILTQGFPKLLNGKRQVFVMSKPL